MGDGGAHSNKNIHNEVTQRSSTTKFHNEKSYLYQVWFFGVKMSGFGVRTAIVDHYTAKINNMNIHSSKDEDKIVDAFRKFCCTELFPEYEDMNKILKYPVNISQFSLDDYASVKNLATSNNSDVHKKLGKFIFNTGGFEKMQELFYVLSQITVYMLNKLGITDPEKIGACLWLCRQIEYEWDGIGEWMV